MKRLFTILAVALAAIGLLPSTAGATPVPCFGGWYVDNWATSSVMNCAIDANHINIDQYINGTYVGSAHEAWIPSAIDVSLVPTSGSTASRLRYCPVAGTAFSAQVSYYQTPAGWDAQFVWYDYGGTPHTEGVFRALNGYGAYNNVFLGVQCANGLYGFELR